MKSPPKPSAVERLAGSLPLEVGLTAIAAMAGGAIAPLLPVLAKSLAAKRQQQRIETFLLEVQESLEAQEALVRSLTDEQYKLVNEILLAALQTTQDEKLNFLRKAMQGAISTTDLQTRDAAMLSRVVRDISAEEAAFLLSSFKYVAIQLKDPGFAIETPDNVLRVNPESAEALNVSGLLSLGLLAPPESAWNDAGVMRFTSLAAKTIAILRRADA